MIEVRCVRCLIRMLLSSEYVDEYKGIVYCVECTLYHDRQDGIHKDG